jgi:prepilin-type N-terminal cleavage/methylation domain-containing protein
MNSLVLRRARGFTLIELLITIALTVVLLTLGVPSMKSFFDRERLIGATEQIYSHLQEARIESIARSRSIYASILVDADGNLTYGFSQREPDPDWCDPSETDVTADKACVLIRDDGQGTLAKADVLLDDPGVAISDYQDDLILMSFEISDFTGITVTDNDLQIEFEPLRGTASSSGSVELQTEDGTKQLNIEIGLLGQIKICSPNDSVSGYSDQCSG